MNRLPTVWRVFGVVVVLAAVIAAMALLVEHDAASQTPNTDGSIGDLLNRHGYLAGFALIYVEESGVPLFIPGDAFLLYVGHRLPTNLPILVSACIGFTLAVTLGATNLYLLARRYGRKLLEHRLAKFLHLTPSRMDRAESWFRAWGPWALIFGRHVPGLRVPLTVAAGVLKLPFRRFAISVAVSSSAWAGIFLLLGAIFGDGLERSIRANPYLFGLALVGLFVAAMLIVGLRRMTARSRQRRSP